MAITVTKTNTRLYKSADGSWVRIVHDAGALDDAGNAITVEASLTMAALEKQEGVLLPKARIKAILEAELNRQGATEAELTTAL